MALPNNIRNNFSSTTQATNTKFQNGYPIAGTPSNPSEKINAKLREKNLQSSAEYTFPTDISPVHFGLVETEWNVPTIQQAAGVATSALNIIPSAFNISNTNLTQAYRILSDQVGNLFKIDGKQLYRLPLPVPLVDQLTVNYNTNFGLDSFKKISETVSSPITALGSATVGTIPNLLNVVTLSQPSFRDYTFTWALTPKNYQESQIIQRIIMSIKRGMHPRQHSIAGRFLLTFPRIYFPFFTPNAKYLYKFKPSVITGIQTNYQGGQPVPSFYRKEDSEENRPPESIQLALTFKELEYWLEDSQGSGGEKSDFKIDQGTKLPTDIPFDTTNFYGF